MLETGLPLSPAPSPVPSVRNLQIDTPHSPLGTSTEHEIKELFDMLSPDAQGRVLQELIKNSQREVLLEARSVLEPRLRHDPFKILPIEISLRILSYINDPKSLASAAQVSRRWYFLLRDDSTWKQMCYEHHFRRLSAAGSYIHHWRPTRTERASSVAIEEDTPEPQDENEAMQVETNTNSSNSHSSNSHSNVNHSLNSVNHNSYHGVNVGNSVFISSQPQSQPPARSSHSSSHSGSHAPPHSGGQRARRSSLLRIGSGTDPLMQYGLRLPNFGQDAAVARNNEPEGDPIGEAYYDPRACQSTAPDSYRSHFQQQYMQSQAWATGGRLAGRYSLPGHGDAIVTCVLMKDGYIVVALDTSLILVFHSDGQLVRSLYGHVMGVWTLALDGNVLISGGCDRDVREWDLSSGSCLKIMRGHASTVRCLALGCGIAVSGARDTTVRVWDLEQGVAKHILYGHSASVRRVELLFAEDQPIRAVSASYDGTAIIWDVESGAKLHTLQGHTNQIYALAVNPKFVVTGSLDHSIRVWDPNTGDSRGCLLGHTALVGQLALQDSLLVSGGSDGSVRVWDLSSMRCNHRIAAHDNTISCLSLAGDRVVTGGPDCQISVWNVRSGELIRMLEKNSVTTVWSVAAQEDRLLTVYSEGSDIVIELMSFVPPMCNS